LKRGAAVIHYRQEILLVPDIHIVDLPHVVRGGCAEPLTPLYRFRTNRPSASVFDSASERFVNHCQKNYLSKQIYPKCTIFI